MRASGSATRVSVVMCTYNGRDFIDQQLRSILTQTRSVDELVVADDGSSDGTPERVRAIVADHRRLHPDAVFDFVELAGTGGEPLGVAANFSRALEASTGEYIILSDQDDVWVPERLETLVRELDARPEVALVHSDATLIGADGEPLGITLFGALGVSERELKSIERGRAFEVLLRRNLVTGATVMLRREVVERALPVPDGWIHDEWLGMIAATLWVTAVVRAPLVGYRQHDSNEIGATELTIRRRIQKLREPREERNRNLFRRSQSFVDRLEELGSDVPRKWLTLARLKLEHERRRTALPTARWRRVSGVAAGWVTGSYRRFGLGGQDVLRDLVQPSD